MLFEPSHVLFGLFLVHVVLLRLIPKALGWKVCTMQDIAVYLSTKLTLFNRSYVWYSVVLDSSFTPEQFQDWIDQTVANDRHINYSLAQFGPETFLLFYLIPRALRPREQIFTVENVRNRKDYREFLSSLYNTTRYAPGGHMYEVHFIPNFEDGPTVVFGFQAILFDGVSFFEWLRGVSDLGTGAPSGYQASQVKLLARALTSAPITLADIPQSDRFRSADLRGATIQQYQVPSWDLTRALTAARAHGMTINDIFIAALSSAYTSAHEKSPQRLLHVFAKDMRDYDGAPRIGHESSYGFLELPAQEVSLQYLKHIVNEISKLKDGFSSFVSNYARSYAVYWRGSDIIDPPWRNNFMIMSSNIKGPEDYLYIHGARVNHITVPGPASYCSVSLSSYVGKLTATIVYSQEAARGVIETYANGLNDAWHAYVDMLLG